MKKLLLLLFLIPIANSIQGQNPSGKIIIDRLYSSTLENNGGEDPTRRITIYLPPDYDKTTIKYPVIYFLHGFTINDSIQIAYYQFDKLLDKAIATGKIKPVIVVIPNQYTLFEGSWYTNSSLTGNWSDFTAKDLVSYVDRHYRTIPKTESRGITGHSMGGHGAIKMGMLFPDLCLISSCIGFGKGIRN